MPQPLYPQEKSGTQRIWGWGGEARAGLDGWGKYHHQDRSSDHPDHSESLYQLCYPWVRYAREGARYTKIYIKHNILIYGKLWYPATPFLLEMPNKTAVIVHSGSINTKVFRVDTKECFGLLPKYLNTMQFLSSSLKTEEPQYKTVFCCNPENNHLNFHQSKYLYINHISLSDSSNL